MGIKRTKMEDVPPLSAKRIEEIREIKDKDIDYSDIPPLDSDFWKEIEQAVKDDLSKILSSED